MNKRYETRTNCFGQESSVSSCGMAQAQVRTAMAMAAVLCALITILSEIIICF